ncbi:MAG TPA: alpha-L-fucosidase [Desulfuromonadaceae bacterium]|nr:alpha-L-fucosidase [Desulfuromonadaceae bacterium]
MLRFASTLLCLLFAFSISGCRTAHRLPPGSEQNRSDWMRGRWGVMTHYLADWQARDHGIDMSPEQWNRMVSGFDVEGLADQIQSTGAGYHFLTVAQGSSYFVASNAAWDKYLSLGTNKAAHRDLILDMARADQKRGIRLIVYSTCHGPRDARSSEWSTNSTSRDHRNVEHMLAWEKVTREWSLRWGTNIAGWWFDGCYNPNELYDFPDPPNFQSLAAAARAGNPHAVLAFNRGVIDRVISITPFEDYSAGEINEVQTTLIRRATSDGRVDGARIHKLSYLGRTWGTGEPRYTNLDEVVIPWTRKVIDAGGAMTWDAPVQTNGLIADNYLAQLRAIGKAVAEREKTNSVEGKRGD